MSAIAVTSQTSSGQALPTKPLGYRQLTSQQLQTAQSLPDIPAGATRAILQSNGVQAIRYRDDGQDPAAPSDTAAAVGQRIEANEYLDYMGDLTKMRVIGEGAGSVLDIAYYG